MYIVCTTCRVYSYKYVKCFDYLRCFSNKTRNNWESVRVLNIVGFRSKDVATYILWFSFTKRVLIVMRLRNDNKQVIKKRNRKTWEKCLMKNRPTFIVSLMLSQVKILLFRSNKFKKFSLLIPLALFVKTTNNFTRTQYLSLLQMQQWMQ